MKTMIVAGAVASGAAIVSSWLMSSI